MIPPDPIALVDALATLAAGQVVCAAAAGAFGELIQFATLGILLMAGCFGYLADAFAGLVLPEWRALLGQGVMLAAMAELATVVWLLATGVKRPAKEQGSPVAA